MLDFFCRATVSTYSGNVTLNIQYATISRKDTRQRRLHAKKNPARNEFALLETFLMDRQTLKSF